MIVPFSSFETRILEGDRVRTVEVQGRLLVRQAAPDQVDPAPGILVPCLHRGKHLRHPAARDAPLAVRVDHHANALAPVELPPASWELRSGAAVGGRQVEGGDDRRGFLSRIAREVVGQTVGAGHVIGDAAAKPDRVARAPLVDPGAGGRAVGDGPDTKRRFALQHHAAGRRRLEEHAQGEFDGAVDAIDWTQEEQHPVAFGERWQAGHPAHQAVRTDAAGLANDDRAARNEALEHLLDPEHDVGGERTSRRPGLGGDQPRRRR